MWPDAENTQQLLSLARQGNADAVNQLMDRHRDSLRRLIRMRLDQRIQRRVDVSDVVQDVLIEANRRLESYLQNPAMAFHLWLRHIARDRIIDAHRRHRASEKRSVDRERAVIIPSDMHGSTMDLIGQLRDAELTPAAAAVQKEMTLRVEQAMTHLDEQDLEILVMRHYEHLSNGDVAQALELSEPAASMRYLRAIRRLRTLLGESSNRHG